MCNGGRKNSAGGMPEMQDIITNTNIKKIKTMPGTLHNKRIKGKNFN